MQFERIVFTLWQERKLGNIYSVLSCYCICVLHFSTPCPPCLSTANCGEHCKQCDRPGKCNKCESGYTAKHGKCKRKSNILHGCSFSLECYWPTLKFKTWSWFAYPVYQFYYNVHSNSTSDVMIPRQWQLLLYLLRDLWLMNVVRIISIKTSSNWSPKLDWNEYGSFSWLTQSVLTMELNMKELISHRDRKGNSEKLYGILSSYYVCAVFLDSKFLIHSTAKCGEYCKQCDRPGKCNKCVRGYTAKHGKCKRKSNILHGCSFSLECYWPTLKLNT